MVRAVLISTREIIVMMIMGRIMIASILECSYPFLTYEDMSICIYCLLFLMQREHVYTADGPPCLLVSQGREDSRTTLFF